jgi:hypothetical protein
MTADAITKDSVVRASQEQVSCDMAGEAAILDLKSGQYYGLNAVGARIWSLIQEPKRVEEILAALLEEFETDAERCETDLLTMLEQLNAKKLIEVRDGTAE